MRKNIPATPLTDKNIKDIKPGDVIAITIASGGAMGDPSAIEITDKDFKVYYTHLGEISEKKLKKLIPFLDQISEIFSSLWTSGQVEINDNWTGIYTGFGNSLFVNPKLKQPILDYIKTNFKDSDSSPTVELYVHWYDTLKEVIKPKVKMDKETEAKIKELNQIWDDFFEDLTAEMPRKCKDYVKTKEGRGKFMHWYFKSDHDEYPWAFFTEENMR